MCSTEKVALIDECIVEVSRITCAPLTKLQNDAMEYFDKQVTPHAILNSIKYEVLDTAFKLFSCNIKINIILYKNSTGIIDNIL